MKNDPLFQPFTLGQLTLKNRVMSTSHAIAYQDEGKPKERYQAYHEEKAKGGLALTMFGGSSNIDYDSASVFGQLYVGNDDIVPYLQAFSERIHQHGAALMCQVTHLGRRSSDRGDWWLPTIGPSRSRERLHRAFCKQMDVHDIQRVQQAYADAAVRCLQGGLDGIELFIGSHLPGQFLAPFTNQRQDAYGGSFINRMRFLHVTLVKIKEQVGSSFLVGIRMPCEENDGGIGFQESLALAERLSNEKLVDFFNVYYGRMDEEHSLADNHLPGMASISAPFLEKASIFKQAVSLPIFHATRVTDVATARYAIKEGLIDMVAMTRAHIADPYLVQKIQQGQEARIRPCVGATLCSTDYRVCIHNAATGAEQYVKHRITSAQKSLHAVVIGGGVAGMEAARVLALRGHSVHLFEAQPRLGGQVRLAAQVPWRKDLLGIIDWLEGELEQLAVTVHCNHWLEADEVLAESPELVIVATGGMPDMEGIQGLEHAMSSWDVLAGDAVNAENVFVFDETGRHAGTGVADYLAEQGIKVTLVSVDGMIGRELTETDQVSQRRRFAQQDLTYLLDRELVKIEGYEGKYKVQLRHLLTGELEDYLTDQVIVERGTTPLDDLYYDLEAGSSNQGVTDIPALLQGKKQPHITANGGYCLYRVGDAISSRGIHEAIKDSLRLCNSM